jgi:hypothetical protein
VSGSGVLARLTLSVALVVIVASTATPQSGRPAEPGSPSYSACIDTVYRGFDSRLHVDVSGKVPLGDDPVVGFEVLRGRPLVAFKRRVVAVDGTERVALPSLDPILGLSVDGAGHAWLHAGEQLRRVGAVGADTGRVAPGVRVYNSGSDTYLLVESEATASRALLRDAAGRVRSAFTVDGPVVAASQNAAGLSLLVGSALLTWPADGSAPLRLADDPVFRSARDLATIGADAAVMALANSLLLVRRGSALVIGVLQARVRWADGTLYVLDLRTGVVWRLAGIETLTDAAADRAYAGRLVAALPAGAGADSPAFLEAARLVGCRAALDLWSGRTRSPRTR